MDPPSRDASSHPPSSDSMPVSPEEARNAEDTLSTSYQSTDTVRRRPEVLIGSYGTMQSPGATGTTSAQLRPEAVRTPASSQAGRSPLLGPERVKASRARKPPMPRRTSGNPQAPHRGGVFSVDDDIAEIEAEFEQQLQQPPQQQQQPQLQQPQPQPQSSSYGTRRRPHLASTLSRVQSRTTTDDGGNGEPSDDEGDNNNNNNSNNNNGSTMQDEEDEQDELELDENMDHESDGDISDAESFTLKDRQQAINETHPFGIRLWKPALYKKSRSVQKTAEGDIHSTPGTRVSNWLLFFNLLWTLIFGWWMAAIAAVGATICFLFAAAPSARAYGRVLWGLARYLFYPFGKFVRLLKDEAYLHEDQGEGRSISEYEQWQSGDLEYGRLFFGPEPSRSIVGRSRRSIDSDAASETDSLLGRGRAVSRTNSGGDGDNGGDGGPRSKRRLFGRGQWNVGRVIFFVFFYFLIAPALFVVSITCWFLVFWIPMGKTTMLLFDHLRRHPLALSFETGISAVRDDTPHSSTILLCTYRAVGPRYWKYTIDGTNIFLINLMAVVVFVIFDWLVLTSALHLDTFVTTPGFLFPMGLLSIIPLAYFIGQAVASISAQSSMGLGAAINAFFSTVVEVYLYIVALNEGKAQLVEGSIVGSIFAGILFLPGLSMCFGAIKRKTQRFNAKSAGVTSTMLLFAVLGAFGPTLFYQIYGTHEMTCLDCVNYGTPNGPDSSGRDCRRCYFSQVPSVNDRFYLEAVRPYCYLAAVCLFLMYVVGLWFTLRTHAAVIWNSELEEKKHDEPPSQNTRQSAPLSFAESTGTDIRDTNLYKRILGQSLKQVGLHPQSSGATGSTSGTAGTNTTAQHGGGNGSAGTPHVVPPKPTPPHHHHQHQVQIPGLSESENHTLVREVAEMAATAATIAARDVRFPRRTSGLNAARPHHQQQQQAADMGVTTVPAKPSAPHRSHTSHTFQQEHSEADAHGTAGGGQGGHDAPNWSRLKSSIILLGATIMYAIVAEILVSTVDVVLEQFHVEQKFLGITLFALVPNTTEFLNAISFAMNGNIALSMEIGSAYALQVCMLQIPALVFFTAVHTATPADGEDISSYMFSLLFPQWDMVTVIICVFLLSYMYGEGKSNYFKGSILLLSYLIVVVGFYFSGFTSMETMGLSRFDTLDTNGDGWTKYKTIGRGTSGMAFGA